MTPVVCVVGGGGREHALATVLGRTADVVATPGNPGIAGRTPTGHLLSSTPAPPEEVEADLYVIGPEAPLVDGLADRLRARGRLVFGPGCDGARLEGSKEFMKRLCSQAGVPTARFEACGSMEEARKALRGLPGPYVVKTDGLAAGKGVLVTDDLREAEADAEAKLSGESFGPAGRRLVIEEALVGPEVSVLAVCDGRRAVALPPAQDFKALRDGGRGPNTGGMGAYSPVPVAGRRVVEDVMERIVDPTLHELARRGIDYRGVLYAGIILTSEGPKLIEFNARFGDPEAEVVLPLQEGDVTEMLARAAGGALDETIYPLLADAPSEAAVCVVAAAPGYPNAPVTGIPIAGLDEAGMVDGVTVFHAGTRLGDDGVLRSAGGRVLCVSARAHSLGAARRQVYEGLRHVHFDGMQFRSDIAAMPADNAVIGRYSLPEMAALFSDEARYELWLEIELLAVEAWAAIGVAGSEDAATCRERAPVVDEAFVEAVAAREAVIDHDVAAFVDVVQEAIGPPAGSWIHHGLTSSDVVDTALSVTLTRAARLIGEALDDLVAVLKRRALEHAGTVMVGRTHGMHAEPTTFGTKLAHACLQADRDRVRLREAREAVSVGKLSGAVGTYSNIDPAVEDYVCNALGLRPVPATQVISRDRHAQYLYALAAIGTTIESLSTEIRHLQRTEVGEVEEAFSAGQKGSSSMPHKRNPITAERLSGLARVLRGYLVAGLEDVTLWHERDISHSSVERIILPDASLVAYYAVRRMSRLIDGLVVHAGRMRVNLLEGSHGLVFSQPVLLALVAAGLKRDDAYRIVQRDAARAVEERATFRAVLENDPDVVTALGDTLRGALDDAFDVSRALRHTNRIFAALEEVEA